MGGSMEPSNISMGGHWDIATLVAGYLLGWSMELHIRTSNGEGTLMLQCKHKNGDINRTLIFFFSFGMSKHFALCLGSLP